MQGPTQPTLTTFCHISDVGEFGYQRLHRMITVSWPLTLWSPSSVLLNSRGCRVTPKEFVKLIEDGVIRIIGREPWILDRTFRNNHPWPGAKWDSYVEGAIRDIYFKDNLSPGTGRTRVTVAPSESGKEWAEGFLSEHPEQIAFWSHILNGPRSAEQIPPGTLDALRRMNADAYMAAEYVLRTARNHGKAMLDAGADVDFMLRPADAEFMKVLASAQVGDSVSASRVPIPRSSLDDQRASRLAAQLLEILAWLDAVRGRRSLKKFVKSGGHAQLASWFASFASL